jgi:hypothetical protein
MAKAVSCPRCDKRLPEEAQFCRRCGTGLRGRAVPAAQPPLVSTGYDSPLPAWQDPFTRDGSPVVGYEPHGKRQPRRRKPVPARGASSSKGWWVILLVGFLSFRACSTFNTSHRRYDPPRRSHPTPPVRIAPREDRSPQLQEDPPAQPDSPAQPDEFQGTEPDDQEHPPLSP